MPARYAGPGGEIFEAALFEGTAFDQIDGRLRETRRRIDARIARRELGPAPQTWPIALDLGGRRAGKEMTVLAPRRAHGAHGPAADARRRDAHEEAPGEGRMLR